MNEMLTSAGYGQTKQKLAQLEQRLARLAERSDLSHQHLAESKASYEEMISQYRRDIKLYEALHHQSAAS